MLSISLLFLFVCLWQDVSTLANDNIRRVGLVTKILSKEEYLTLHRNDEMNINGVVYQKMKTSRGEEIKREIPYRDHLLILDGYCAAYLVNDCFDLLVVTNMRGITVGRFVTAAKLVKLKRDEDLSLGVYEHAVEGQALELVDTQGFCTQVMNGADTTVSLTYDCSHDNFEHYRPGSEKSVANHG